MTPVVTSAYQESAQTDYTINMGDSVTFYCEATGIPPPSIAWYRNGTKFDNITNSRVTLSQSSTPIPEIDKSGAIMVYSVNRTLTLMMSEDADSGSYECRASNEAIPGENSVKFVLIVQSKYSGTWSLYKQSLLSPIIILMDI